MNGRTAKQLRRFCLGDMYHSHWLVGQALRSRKYRRLDHKGITLVNEPGSFRARYQAIKKMFYRSTQTNLGPVMR